MSEINVQKEVRFLNKDFLSLREALIEFTKQYFPNTFADFNETSVGMMFLEMSAYVGDVLSYYIDSTLKENLILYAEEEKNVIGWSQALGYTPSLSVPASTIVDVFQIVPVVGGGINSRPDYSYALTIERNLQIGSDQNPNVIFRTVNEINFKHSSSFDPTEVTVFQVDSDNKPLFYLLRKKVEAVAGEIKTINFTFGTSERFTKVTLPNSNIIDVIDATDSDGNTWYKVPFLAQDTIFEENENVAANDPELAQYNDQSPYILKLVKSARRFITRIRGDKKTELQFGSGISDNPDELLIPNPTNIGSNLFGSVSFGDTPIDPVNFLYTKTYGQVPQNTTLSIRYIVGGGLESNVNKDELTILKNIIYRIDETSLDADLLQQVKNSVATTNTIAASGGRDGESIEEMRMNALSHFPTQLRAVTKEDYIIRVYSMPSRFGSVSKAYIVQDDQLNENRLTTMTRNHNGKLGNRNSTSVTGESIPSSGDRDSIVDIVTTSRISNPFALNLYVLGYNKDKQLVNLNRAVKENLKTYLSQYRMMTDAINIKNGYVINIKVKFEIIVFKSFNKREIVLKCIDNLKEYFDIDKWQFNQPIIMADIQRQLFSVEGVQGVVNVEVVNVFDEDLNYSGNVYNIESSTKDGIIYPSLDPSIFEVKFLNSDIEGRAL